MILKKYDQEFSKSEENMTPKIKGFSGYQARLKNKQKNPITRNNKNET